MADVLKKTPLFALHQALGATMTGFAGHALPLQFGTGIRHEHLHCRQAASLFDVSHMGQIEIPRTAASTAALEQVLPTDLQTLGAGQQRYTLLLNAAGGIVDDLLISHDGQHFQLVVNAARCAQDLAYLDRVLPPGTPAFHRRERALLALQGPAAVEVLEPLLPGCRGLGFMQRSTLSWRGIPVAVGRSGYTGEDGFELSVCAEQAEPLARALLASALVAPAGLGARDSLRLEAGLCLYGQDLDEQRTPIAARLNFCISPSRRPDGGRPGGFVGAERIFSELASPPLLQRCGLVGLDRGLLPQGAAIRDATGRQVGVITSSCYSFSLRRAIAMGYLSRDAQTPLSCRKRDQSLALAQTALPFVSGKKP